MDAVQVTGTDTATETVTAMVVTETVMAMVVTETVMAMVATVMVIRIRPQSSRAIQQ